jgi:murein L,D-transpeptidase YcbB/YkuD
MVFSDCRFPAFGIPALRGLTLALAVLAAGAPPSGAAETREPTAFVQALAVAASEDQAIADWYRTHGYRTLWTGAEDAARRQALFTALATAGDHGLPVARYDANALLSALLSARTEGDRGRAEIALTRAYLAWAHDLTSGAIAPGKVDPGILREIAVIDPAVLLSRIATGDPQVVLHWLEPKSPAYLNLMKAKIRLEADIARGGWGAPVPAETLSPEDTGPAVVALRDRLVRMGYLAHSATGAYDRKVEAAVVDFQLNHGLTADGIVNDSTLAELNKGPEERLKSVIVALERERWMDYDRSARHIWVNLPDFTAKIVDHGRTVFETRVVIGKNVPDQRSPEFSDVMEHMVINPSWGVPRSIIVKEYLPLLQANPNAVSHLQVIDGRGRVVPRGAVNFAAYNARNFPFALRQPPSDDNALGLVKFMFPNPYNIYLHDTPSKSLFAKEVRAYSHGCIRVADPFDLAHALLSVQSADAEAEFDARLKTGDETTVRLLSGVPVHLVYFTAYPGAKGRISYRRDIYGRDAALFDALSAAGVELASVRR